MNRLNFTDLYRFIVSLGIIFYVFAISIPWLFLRDTYNYRLTVLDSNKLTEESLWMVAANFKYLKIIMSIIPYLSGLLFSVGTFAIIYGLRRWYKKQLKADEKEEIELDLLRLQIPSKKPKEVEEFSKLEQEGKNNSNEELQQPTEKYNLSTNLSESTESIIHNSIVRSLTKSIPIAYEVKEFASLDPNRKADILLQSHLNKNKDAVIENIYFKEKISFDPIIKKLFQLENFRVNYYNKYKKEINGLLVIVCGDKLSEMQKTVELNNTLKSFLLEKKWSNLLYQIVIMSELDSATYDMVYITQ